MAKALLVISALLVAFAAAGAAAAEVSDIDDPKLQTITVIEGAGKVGGTYCCLKNGYGCLQNCESDKSYYCCLKNGYGCQWKCENGKEHYCCEKNGYGCTKMCPKTTSTNPNELLIALPAEE